MKVLKDFIGSFDFVRMKPLNSVLKDPVSGAAKSYVLAEPNRAYALYLARGEKPAPGEVVVSLELPDGRYRAEIGRAHV